MHISGYIKYQIMVQFLLDFKYYYFDFDNDCQLVRFFDWYQIIMLLQYNAF